MKGHERKKRDGSLLLQLGVTVVCLLAVSAIVTGTFTWYCGATTHMDTLRSVSSNILVQLRTDMQDYASLAWLLDYWQGHHEEMDLDGDVAVREADVAAALDGLGLADARDVTEAQAQDLSPALRLRFAEHCYLDVNRTFCELLENFGLETVYCASYGADDTAFPLFQGRHEGGGYALGETWPFDLDLHPALQEMLESGGNVTHFETVTSTSDGIEYLFGYLPVVPDSTCYACVAYSTAHVQEQIREDAGVVVGTNALVKVVFAVAVLMLGRSFLAKLSLVQDEVRRFRAGKDTAAAVEGLSAIHANNEVGRLAEDVRDMIVELDRHAAEVARLSAEREHIETELALAAQIQKTSLPSVFPPYPDRSEFGLYASMDAAREVGGDFYDFFLVDEDRLAVLVADVSDKGIPAALYMMRAKAAIKDLAMAGLHADEVMMRANDDLVTNNEAGMFVTAWLGIIDLGSGLVEYVHAGHTCPVCLGGGEASFVRKRRELFLGGRAHVRYSRQELHLAPGDALFLYSDGVTEAMDADGDFFGSERLLEALVKAQGSSAADPNENCRAVCASVRADVATFAEGTEQSDDITMLCLRFEG